MKFNCEKKFFEKSLNIAERFIGRNLTLPILSNILIETAGDKINLTATNLEHAVQINFDGKVSKEGKICVPAKTIVSLVQAMKEDRLDLEEKNNNLMFRTASKEARLNGLVSEEFPIVPPVKKKVSFEVDAKILKKGLEKVLPAVAVSDFKPEFTGIYFSVNSQGEVKLVATDTFRLAENSFNTQLKNNHDNLFFIIPRAIGQELSRILEDEDEIKITIGDNQILFEMSNIKITSRLIDGNFPEYTNIIPKKFENSAYVSRNDFKEIIKTASIFSSKLSDVSVEFQDKDIKISTANSELGEYKTIMPAKIAEGSKNVKLNFNYKYLLDGINSLEDDEVFIGCNTENSPALFKNKSAKDFVYILMPIKTI